MQADLYRFFQGKLPYVTAAVITLFSAMMVFVFQTAISTVNVSTEEDPILGMEVINGAEAVSMAFGAMNLIMWVVLAVGAIISMALFDSGTIKNEIATGMGRIQLYLSRLAVTSGLTVLFMAFFLAVVVVFGIIVGGLGDWTGDLVLDALQVFATQALFAVGFCSICTFLAFTLRREGAAIWVYIGVSFAPVILVSLLSLAWPDIAGFIAHYELASLMDLFAEHGALLTSFEFVRGLLVGLAYIAVPAVAGILLFKRADIK
ncbi:MAG: ABC transporter permease subunit [Coriobacteriia bacterium]|nr:ABC transporter permease subunit [Coriobacteriia bacterium]MCL2871197.1 ABC transporter permease subunit [Coriobacteriia bacterium]